MAGQNRLTGLTLALLLCGQVTLGASPSWSAPQTVAQHSRDAGLQRAAALNQQAFDLAQAGRYREAEPLYLEALAIRRERLGDRHLDVANSLNNLAELYRTQGRYGEAEILHREALAIYREQLGERHLNVAISLNNLALTYYAQGRYGEAATLFQAALEIRREQLGAHHPSVATGLNNLAGLYDTQGRYREAEPLYLEAVTIYREQLGDRHPNVANSLSNLAVLYRIQGRYDEAEPLHLEALDIRRERLGDRHPEVAASLNNLAELYRAQGRYGEAEPLQLEALDIRRERLGDRHPEVAQSLGNLALIYRAQGRYGEAEPLQLEALEIRRERLGDHHPDVAISLNNLASLYYVQGRYGEAETLFQQALEIYREQLGDGQGPVGDHRHPNVAIALNNLAELYRGWGKSAEAIHYLQAGLDIEEWYLDLNLATLANTQRQDYVATLLGTTDAALSLHLQSAPDRPDAAALALTTLLRRKGRILDAGVNSLQVLRQNLTPADQALLDAFTTVRQQLATLTFNPPNNLSLEQYQAELTRLETEANTLETSLARSSAAFRAETRPVDLVTVQAKLPTDSVLVEYIRYQPFDGTNTQNPWGNDRYAAYLLFPNGDIQAVDLGDAAAIDTATQAFIHLLQDPSTFLGEGIPKPMADTLTTLIFPLPQRSRPPADLPRQPTQPPPLRSPATRNRRTLFGGAIPNQLPQ
ncbi:MAG: tetratricopeptide repeat protein [Cyanobacteria bacterium]|nr:tetratricopeptide repeat protein [Cyanobacteriota bacterium]